MRLQQARHILDANLPTLQDIDFTPVTLGGNQVFFSTNSPLKSELLAAIGEINKIPGLDSWGIPLLQDDFIRHSQSDILHAPQSLFQPFHQRLKQFLQVAQAYQRHLQVLLGTPETLQLSIKLPEASDLQTLIEHIKKIENIFRLTVTAESLGDVKFVGVDRGSAWLEILLSTNAAYGLFASIVWVGRSIFRERGKVQKEIEEARRLKLHNDDVAALQETKEKLLEAMLDEHVHDLLHSDEHTENNHERINQLKQAIHFVSELQAQGAEFEPSLSAPTAAKRLLNGLEEPDSARRILALPPGQTTEKSDSPEATQIEPTE